MAFRDFSAEKLQVGIRVKAGVKTAEQKKIMERRGNLQKLELRVGAGRQCSRVEILLS